VGGLMPTPLIPSSGVTGGVELVFDEDNLSAGGFILGITDILDESLGGLLEGVGGTPDENSNGFISGILDIINEDIGGFMGVFNIEDDRINGLVIGSPSGVC